MIDLHMGGQIQCGRRVFALHVCFACVVVCFACVVACVVFALHVCCPCNAWFVCTCRLPAVASWPTLLVRCLLSVFLGPCPIECPLIMTRLSHMPAHKLQVATDNKEAAIRESGHLLTNTQTQTHKHKHTNCRLQQTTRRQPFVSRSAANASWSSPIASSLPWPLRESAGPSRWVLTYLDI